MKHHDIKIYGQSTAFPAHRALTDFTIIAPCEASAAKIARENYEKKFNGGMQITHVEIGGSRYIPGLGVAV